LNNDHIYPPDLLNIKGISINLVQMPTKFYKFLSHSGLISEADRSD